MIKKKIKILRIFSRLNIGGPSFHVINLADRMKDYNYETLLLTGQCSPWEGDLSFYAKEKNVYPIYLSRFSYRVSVVNDLISFFQIFEIIYKEKPDIVHTHTFKAGLLGRIAAYILKVPIIVHTYHGHLLSNYWSGWKIYLLKSIEKSLGRITTACIGVSQQVSTDLIAAKIVPAEKMKTVELGFDFNYLLNEMSHSPTLRKKLNISNHHFVFGTACRLVPIKDIQMLISASIPFLKSNEDSHLIIVGQGPEKDNLLHSVNTLTAGSIDMISRIHFLDWITPFQRELNDFNLYICSSKNEGTSVSVIEAMVAKIPVISTSVGGMPDLLENGLLGTLLKSNTAEALTHELSTAYTKFKKNEKNDTHLQSVKEKTQERFGESRLAKDIHTIYTESARSIGSKLEI